MEKKEVIGSYTRNRHPYYGLVRLPEGYGSPGQIVKVRGMSLSGRIREVMLVELWSRTLEGDLWFFCHKPGPFDRKEE
jgi:hypothetical protein